MNLGIGRRESRTLTNSSGWTKLDESYKITGPVVICIAGNATMREREANGFAKMISENLGIRTSVEMELGIEQSEFPAELLSVWYNGSYSDSPDFIKQSDYENRGDKSYVVSQKEEDYYNEVKNSFKDFFNKYFRPLIVDSNGNRLDVRRAMKNVRNINIVSFCYGTVVVSHLENIMKEELKRLNYSEQETSEIQKQMFTVNCSALLEFGTAKSTSTNFNVLDDEDSEKSKYSQRHTNPEIHGKELVNGIGITQVYSQNESVFAVPSVSGYEDSHYGPLYFRMSSREKYGFTDPSYGDILPALITDTLQEGISNSVKNFDTPEFIPLDSLEKRVEMVESLLSRFNGKNYSETVADFYKEVREKVFYYVRRPTKEETKKNNEIDEMLKKYAALIDGTESNLNSISSNMDEIKLHSTLLMSIDFEGKEAVISKIRSLSQELENAIKIRNGIDREERPDPKAIDAIRDINTKTELIKKEVSYVEKRDAKWSEILSACCSLSDFERAVVLTISDVKDKNTKLLLESYIGNGVEYVRKKFSESYPEIAKSLIVGTVKLPKQEDVVMER